MIAKLIQVESNKSIYVHAMRRKRLVSQLPSQPNEIYGNGILLFYQAMCLTHITTLCTHGPPSVVFVLYSKLQQTVIVSAQVGAGILIEKLGYQNRKLKISQSVTFSDGCSVIPQTTSQMVCPDSTASVFWVHLCNFIVHLCNFMVHLCKNLQRCQIMDEIIFSQRAEPIEILPWNISVVP